MARKVFLSVLGSTDYGICSYVSEKSGFKSKPVRFVQEAVLELIRGDNWGSGDIGFVFVTGGKKGSSVKNWFDNGHRDRETDEPLEREGLKSRIEKMNLPFEIIPVPIEDGNDEKEIWKVFWKIFDCLQERDNIYIDITHGFRFLPMLILVLSNYARFLKNANTCHISYGNFEGRNKETNESKIIDLMTLVKLQNWTNGANQFISSGTVQGFTSLLENTSLTESMKEFTDSFLGSRGVDIWEGTSALRLSTELSNIEIKHFPEPFKPILDKIKQKVTPFENGNLIERGIAAVKYCEEHNLIQQGITLLAELVVTYTLLHINHDWKDDFARVIASNCLNINDKQKYDAVRVKADIKQKYDNGKISIEEMESSILKHDAIVDKIFSLDIKNKLGNKIYKKLSQGTRNDINHAGVRTKPKTTEELLRSFQKYFSLFQNFYNQYPCS